MAYAIFKVLFKVIKTLLNIVLLPINALVVAIFPNLELENILLAFNDGVVYYLGGTLRYFSSMLPITTRTFILIYLTILISFYTVSIAVHAIIKLFSILQKLKLW